MKLIDKDALVAEIYRRIKKYTAIDVGNSEELEAIYGAKCKALIDILKFLDTLEVREVNLDKMLTKFMSRYAYENGGEYPSSIDIAKYFFELGLNAQKGE